MPDLKDRQGRVIGKLKLEIKANANSLKENENLVQRSIVPSFKNNHFSIFMVNVASLANKIIDLTNDVYAQVSDHICVVETWLSPNTVSPNTSYFFDIPGRSFDHIPIGKGKGCGIYSLGSRVLIGKSKV